jgi:hypothetical protein
MMFLPNKLSTKVYLYPCGTSAKSSGLENRIVAMNAAVHKFRTNADKAFMLIAPIHDFLV